MKMIQKRSLSRCDLLPKVRRRDALVLVVLTSLVGWSCELVPAGSGDGDAHRLARALAVRQFEPRLSLTSVWTPCTPVANELASVRCGRGRRASEPLRRALDEGPILRGGRGVEPADPETLHRNALWHMARGDVAGYWEATSLLRVALDADPADPDFWNDLAVAEFQLAGETKAPLALVRSLGAIEEASRLAPRDSRIAFNRALILDRLHLVYPAAVAWSEVIALEGSSDWGREAQERRRRLVRREPTTAEDHQQRREELERQLGEWAREYTASGADAGRLAALRRDSATLALKSGDITLQEAVELLQDALLKDPLAFRELAAGHAAMDAATSQISGGLYAASVEELERARALLARHGSAFAGWAELHLLRCAYQRGDSAEVEDLGQSILARLEKDPPSALRGRTWWILGTSRFARGELSGAWMAFERAATEFELLGEQRNLMAVAAMKANLYEWTGQIDDAWRARYAVLSRLRDAPDVLRAHMLSIDAAHSAFDVGEPSAATYFADEALRLAYSTNDSVLMSNAYLHRAKLKRRMEIDAAPDLGLAQREADRIPDPDRRAVLKTEIEAEEVESQILSEPQLAATRLHGAVSSFEGVGPDLLLPELLRAQGRAERLAGSLRKAEATFRQALALLERQSRTVETSSERISLMDRAEELHTEMIELLLARGEPRAALGWAIHSRGRRLAELWPERTERLEENKPVNDAARGIALDTGSAMVVYRILSDRLVSWCRRDDSLYWRSVAISDDRLERMVRDARTAIEMDGDAAILYLRKLADILIAPSQPCLRGARSLYLTPDGILYKVPFEALMMPDGRFLVEVITVALMPRPGVPRDSMQPGPETILVVADPAFDSAAHPSLPRLPGAVEEASYIASLYPNVIVLSRNEATGSALRREVREVEVLHIAAHAIEHPGEPGASSVLLAPESDGLGEIRLGELENLDAPRLRIVVLAGCRTAEGRLSRSEGPIGLAWPFLANGVPQVIATRWEVVDGVSSEFARDLHRSIAGGQPAPVALARAQRHALMRGDRLYDWAAYVSLVGAESGEAKAVHLSRPVSTRRER